MTEGRARHPRPALVFWASVSLFAVLFALLTYQLSAGAGRTTSAAAPVQVRRVIKRRIVTTILPTPGANSVSSGPVSSSFSGGVAPVVTGAS